eukprot:2096227-Amphidinium_carterae.1
MDLISDRKQARWRFCAQTQLHSCIRSECPSCGANFAAVQKELSFPIPNIGNAERYKDRLPVPLVEMLRGLMPDDRPKAGRGRQAGHQAGQHRLMVLEEQCKLIALTCRLPEKMTCTQQNCTSRYGAGS